MKYWTGYLAAALFAALTWILNYFGKIYSQIVDMLWPYVTRTFQGILADWTTPLNFVLWQTLAVVAVILLLASIVLMIIFRWNFIRWLGWVLAGCSAVFCLHTAFYGINYHIGELTEDVRMDMTLYTEKELESAAIYYRDQANALANHLPRDKDGNLVYPSFEILAGYCGDGFEILTYEKNFPVFAGSTQPVKKLGWADMYTSMGITGITIALTGEAAVNPQTPVMALPFTMCHEMAHRMSIAREDDANFAAYLACEANDNIYIRYSGYFMAYRYCINALYSADSNAASRVGVDVNDYLKHDLKAYTDHYNTHRNETAQNIANTANDAYLKVSGDEDGTASYGKVCDQLVNWYLNNYATKDELNDLIPEFDPFDEDQVDLSDLPGYSGTAPTTGEE